MSKKRYFFIYFAFLSLIYLSIPMFIPTISAHDYGLLLFTYQHPTLFVSLFCITNIFFNYLSILISKDELLSINLFIKTRHPKFVYILWHTRTILFPYFGLCVLTKCISWFIYPQNLTIALVAVSVTTWGILFYSSFKLKSPYSNYILFTCIVCSHSISSVLFI